jgi:hypothetical protein
MSDHWENVTDNVKHYWIWFVENVPLTLKGTPQMLITSLDFQLTGRIYRSFERGILKEGMPSSLVKRWYYHKSRIKELHTFEGLGRKK